MDHQAINHEEVWEIWCKSWKVTNPEEKTALFRTCLDTVCQYHDPLAKVDGWQQIMSYMAEFHERFPGAYFVTTEFLTHGDKSIARWEMRGDNDIVLGDGMSYGEYTDQGRLKQMTGFFPVPAD